MRPTNINLGKETDFTQLLEAKTRRTKYLETANVQLTKLFVDARNNLILLFYSQRQKLMARIRRADIKKLVVLVVLIFFVNTLCMDSLLVFLKHNCNFSCVFY